MNTIKDEILNSGLEEISEPALGVIQKRFLFTPDFSGFSGHFPDRPILPAFVQIMAALTILEERKKRPVELAGMGKGKFLAPIRPDQEVIIQIRELEIRGKPGCDIRVTANGTAASSFQLFPA